MTRKPLYVTPPRLGQWTPGIHHVHLQHWVLAITCGWLDGEWLVYFALCNSACIPGGDGTGLAELRYLSDCIEEGDGCGS
jgi:hypothetical protein